jgi:hypothetical protein
LHAFQFWQCTLAIQCSLYVIEMSYFPNRKEVVRVLSENLQLRACSPNAVAAFSLLVDGELGARPTVAAEAEGSRGELNGNGKAESGRLCAGGTARGGRGRVGGMHTARLHQGADFGEARCHIVRSASHQGCKGLSMCGPRTTCCAAVSAPMLS